MTTVTGLCSCWPGDYRSTPSPFHYDFCPLHLAQPQGDLIEHLADLLDDATHDDRCWSDEAGSRCVCLIGRVLDLLPQCPSSKAGNEDASITWRCLRKIHPSSPTQHHYGRI
ncbi:MAG TPA: hypothetical protein VHU81_06445 [Thermoanaerobaculia bacterium]|nr:hypothetical protein [Thermoanaerobaculia bacterium]